MFKVPTYQMLLGSLCMLHWASVTSAQNYEASGRDVVCGPRCVQKLLEYYRRPSEELASLVQELQWPNLLEGTSMQKIASALRKRGFYTLVLKLDHGAMLKGNAPAIVHIKSPGGLGHYVLWVPNKVGGHKIWSWEHQYQTGIWNDLVRNRSGFVLLASPEKPLSVEDSVEPGTDESMRFWGYLAVNVVIWCWVIGIVRRIRR